MAEVLVNRAPFLTLWATVVARRLGYTDDEALTLGKAIAGLTAQSKGRRLGIYAAATRKDQSRSARRREAQALGWTDFMGRRVPSIQTEEGLRALSEATPIDPEKVRRYLQSRFGESLSDVEGKLTQLAASYPPEDLAFTAMSIYMTLRPRVPAGREGWGRQGVLDLSAIDRLIGTRR